MNPSLAIVLKTAKPLLTAYLLLSTFPDKYLLSFNILNYLLNVQRKNLNPKQNQLNYLAVGQKSQACLTWAPITTRFYILKSGCKLESWSMTILLLVWL